MIRSTVSDNVIILDRSDRNEETLLPVSRLHETTFEDRISARNPDTLRSGGTSEIQDRLLAMLGTGGLQGIANGEEDGAAHEERRLAYTPAALDGAQVLPLDVLEERDVHDLRDVTEPGDLVRSRPTGEDLTGRAMPE